MKLTVCLLLCCATIHAAQVPQFQDGDRVCFVGDSITHGGSYHSVVYLYYLTRFPNREIRVWNKGISGDRVHRVLHRLDEDIALAKPTVATVMLGMNDVGGWLYGSNKTDAASQQAQQKELERYYHDMAALIHEFEAIDSEVVLVTPSIYDQTAELKTHNDFGRNDGLGKCADFVKRTASSKGQGFVDFYEAMGVINAQVQRDDPAATIVGADRVHPGADPGHFIMGYLFLKAQGVPQLVSRMVLDAKAKRVLEAANSSVSDAQFGDGSLSFTALEYALPFPQTESIAKGLALLPFEQEMNQELLSVKNLPDGDHTLSIDGIAVGAWSAAQFSEGINLASNELTPQYQQALKVKQLNDTRNHLNSQMRDAAFTFYNSGLSESDVDVDDPTAVEAFLAEKLKDVEEQPWYAYYKENFDAYSEIRAQEDQIRSELETLHERLYQVNQPVVHHYTLIQE